MELMTLLELQLHFERSEGAIRRWRSRGCPGFQTISGRVLGDPEAIDRWLRETGATKPGPRALRVKPEAIGAVA